MSTIISPSSLLRFDSLNYLERLNLDQYHRMLQTGIIAEGSPIELIDGFLIRKDRARAGENIMTIGKQHVFAINQFVCLFQPDLNFNHLRLQNPISIQPNNEPEPDIVIARGKPGDYREDHPQAKDVLLVVEVADSSLSFDRKTKLELYASAGIQHYWIVNLVDRQIEMHSQPDSDKRTYLLKEVARQGSLVALPEEVKPAGNIPVNELVN